MPRNKGFTLVEILVVSVILAILLSVAVPNYLIFIQQGQTRNARNNLIAIYNAQKAYYFRNAGTYCTTTCDSNAHINTNLAPHGSTTLDINDSSFTYTCSYAPLEYKCTATNTADTHLILTLTNANINLPNTNPSCASDIPEYCSN